MIRSPETGVVATILEANRVLQEATRTYDTATIRRLIPDDFSLIASSGRIYGAQDVLAEVADRSIVWYDNETSEADVRPYGPDCAIITAVLHQRYEQNGALSDYRVRFTDTWVRCDGTWLYVAGHASRLA
jgi:ketosteroid isomerase-like protein